MTLSKSLILKFKFMIFSIDDQIAFAELSQDFNPMHCDAVLARRYIYGEPVVHGINAMIFAIKEWSYLSKTVFSINQLRCKFLKPIFLNKKIFFEIKNINNTTNIFIIQNDEIRMKVTMSIDSAEHKSFQLKEFDCFTKKDPNNISFYGLRDYSKRINCSLKLKLAEKYYSNKFIQKIGYTQLAEIISYSRIVGMHAPGLNSIFSELNFCKNINKNENIFFEVKSIDDRFKIINISVNGPNFKTFIKAFYRPLQVKQKEIKELKTYLCDDEFKTYRALVIGASRGLGELTAKCLGFGGANLLLTYATGKSDIMNVREDIKIYNKNVNITSLDINKIQDLDFNIINEFKPTHVFYYATPFIFNGTKNKFSKEIYMKFRIYYLSAFELLVKKIMKFNKNIYLLYPSSIAVEETPSDMLEYARAKKEGEELCMKLEKEYSNLKIFCPRLPRLETDQTVSLSMVKNENPIKILNFIRSMSNS